MVTHWVCNFAIGQLFLPATAQFGVSTVYLGFAGVCILAAIFVQAAVLETKVTLIPINCCMDAAPHKQNLVCGTDVIPD